MVEIPETHRDLLEKNQVVILPTIDPNGFPQTTALWYLLDDDDEIKLSINTSRQKAKKVMRNKACTLFFMVPENPYRTLEICVRPHVQPDPDYVLADKVGERYNVNVREMDQPGESRVAVTFEPIKVNTFG